MLVIRISEVEKSSLAAAAFPTMKAKRAEREAKKIE
jgi:hypothetical protein